MNQDKINQRIQALESELAELKAELFKSEKFMFKYCNTRCNIGSLLEPIKIENITYNYSTTSFNYRKTKENAQADFQLQKELMCVGALAEQIDPDYKSKVVWDGKNYNYYIYFSLSANRYFVNTHTDSRLLSVIYMPKEVAEKVWQILNNKQVEL